VSAAATSAATGKAARPDERSDNDLGFCHDEISDERCATDAAGDKGKGEV
jgi:hypothetical protein